MPLNDFLDKTFTLDDNGENTSLLKRGATVKVVDTGRVNNGVKRLGIEASGFDSAANMIWNAVREAIYVDVGGSKGIIVGSLDDIDSNDDHTFVICREGSGFRVTVNWRLDSGGVGGGPPEDSD